MSARRRRPMIEIGPAELPVSRAGQRRLFLGRFDPPALQRELEGAGLLAALAERGYPEVALLTEAVDDEHRLRLVPRRRRVCVVDLRLAEGSRVGDDPLLLSRGLEILSFLVVHWLSLQDPRGRFTRERPRLPGQKYPGLGVGRCLYALLLGWAAAWGKDGLLSFPEYFHNAFFYGIERRRPATEGAGKAGAGGIGRRRQGEPRALPPFRFLSPARQGRFEALVRDMAHLPIAAASKALEAGRVREAGSGQVVSWEAGEMVVPLSDGLRGFLDSPEYRQAAAAARDAADFRL